MRKITNGDFGGICVHTDEKENAIYYFIVACKNEPIFSIYEWYVIGRNIIVTKKKINLNVCLKVIFERIWNGVIF